LFAVSYAALAVMILYGVLQIHIQYCTTNHTADCTLRAKMFCWSSYFMRNSLTHSMSQGPAEADSSSASREIFPYFVEYAGLLPFFMFC